MSGFEDALKALRNPGEGESPTEQLWDTLNSEYASVTTERDSLKDRFDGQQEVLKEKDVAISKANAEIDRLKRENYELAIRVVNDDGEKSKHENDDAKPKAGIAGLFEPRK